MNCSLEECLPMDVHLNLQPLTLLITIISYLADFAHTQTRKNHGLLQFRAQSAPHTTQAMTLLLALPATRHHSTCTAGPKSYTADTHLLPLAARVPSHVMPGRTSCLPLPPEAWQACCCQLVPAGMAALQAQSSTRCAPQQHSLAVIHTPWKTRSLFWQQCFVSP